MSSSSAFSLALREEDDGKRAGLSMEPNNSSESKAGRVKLSSSSLSLTPNYIMALAAAEGRWSSWVKRTGECSFCDSKARGHWANASSLVTGCSNHLPRCFFLTGPWEEENGRGRGAESLSEKKAILECREARLKLSPWEQLALLSSELAWDFPKNDTHSAWVSSTCNAVELYSFKGYVDRHRMAAEDDRVCKLGAARGPNPAVEVFQRQIPASAKSQRRRELVAEEKKSELQWLERLII